MSDPVTYHAFISHAHEDGHVARWLHRSLEAFRLPSGIRSPTNAADSRTAHPFYPCFIDREELSSGALSKQIVEALQNSRNLIVLCSVDSAKSAWVDLEVSAFLKRHPVTRVFPVLTGDTGRRQVVDLFPKSLRAALNISNDGIGAQNLLATDLRTTGDGSRIGLYKLVAGTSGVLLRDLVARQQKRARRARLIWASVALAVVLIGVELAVRNLAATGRTDLSHRFDMATERLTSGNSDPKSFEIRRPDGLLVGYACSTSGCVAPVGACGCYDEEVGLISPRFATSGLDAADDGENLYEATDLALEKVAARIKKDREFDDWRRGNPIGLPDGPSKYPISTRSKDEFTTGDGSRFFFMETSLPPRASFFRKVWAIISYQSVPDLVRSDWIRFWGRLLPIAALLSYLLVEFLPLRRFLRREPV